MTTLFDKRLIFVTGKGGVGKSTVASALGILAARQGLRTILVEIANQERISQTIADRSAGFHETKILPNLYTISIDPQDAMREYLHLQIKLAPAANLVCSSKMFQYFAAATPGLRELVTIGKVWELTQSDRRTAGGEPYELVIVDGPATGHGIGMLRTPKAFAQIARVGPIASQARRIHNEIVDSRHTGVVAVTLAEEIPVNETLELNAELQTELGLHLDRIIVNEHYDHRFTDTEFAEITQLLEQQETSTTRSALLAARSQYIRASGQIEQIDRLYEQLNLTPYLLPFIFKPTLDLQALEHLADKLETIV